LKTLNGLGDKNFSEWHDDRAQAYHVRRRLSYNEEQVVGVVVDLRGTYEGHDIAKTFLGSVALHPMYRVFEKAVVEEINQKG